MSKNKDKPVEDADKAEKGEKRVKFDANTILDNAQTLKSTERWIASSEKDKEALSEPRNILQEQRNDARLAMEFMKKEGDLELKVALLHHKIDSLEHNLIVHQDWLATKYGPDGHPVKPGWVSVRSSANSAYRQVNEVGDWLIERKYETTDAKTGLRVVSATQFAWKPREEWLAEAQARRAGARGGK